MDQYAEVVGDNASLEDYKKIATHYQRTGNHYKAGSFFLKAEEYAEALSHFLQCSSTLHPDGEHIDRAIEVVLLVQHHFNTPLTATHPLDWASKKRLSH